MPVLGAFFVGKTRVQNGYFVSEDVVNIGGDSWRQSNLWDQQNCRAPRIKHGFHCRQINRGLAGSSYAMQQNPGISMRIYSSTNFFQRRPLLRVEIEVCAKPSSGKRRAREIDRLFEDFDYCALHQCA